MGSGEDDLWLIKVNPKVMELLERLLKMMEQVPEANHQPKATYQEEKVKVAANASDGLLTVAEAAKRLGFSQQTLRNWISQRRISYVKIGRRTLFNPKDLDNLIQSCTIEPWKPKAKKKG